MDLKILFVDGLGRVRSGWRLAIFLVAFIFSTLVLGVLADLALHSLGVDPAKSGTVFLLVNGMFSLIPAVAIGWLCGRYLDRVPFRALGCSFSAGWFKHLVWGSVIGAAAIGIAILIADGFGGLSFKLDDVKDSSAILSSLAISLGIFAVAAAFEEALFRGYILQTLNRSGLGWLAISLTAVFFGLVHLGNPGANIVSTTNTALAGVWFGIAYLKTRDLWFPFGIHLMWNWMQGSVFGIEVSGLKDITSAPLLLEIDRGPAWLTGENYGIEASVACTVAIVISIVVIYFMPSLKPDNEMLAMTSPTNRSLPDLTPSGS